MTTKDIYEFGLAEMRKHKGTPDEKLLYAIAAMLSYKGHEPEIHTKLGIGPEYVFNTLREQCGDKLNLTSYTKGQLDALAHSMKTIHPEVTLRDIDKLASWINNGGLDWWTYDPPHIGNLAKHLPTWINSARGEAPKKIKKTSVLR